MFRCSSVHSDEGGSGEPKTNMTTDILEIRRITTLMAIFATNVGPEQ